MEFVCKRQVPCDTERGCDRVWVHTFRGLDGDGDGGDNMVVINVVDPLFRVELPGQMIIMPINSVL